MSFFISIYLKSKFPALVQYSLKNLSIRHALFIAPALLFGMSAFAEAIAPPAPYGPVPSERQLRWHELETYAFIHFTTNTFTGKEWGYGDESPQVFNPSAFDADQIVGTFADAGMKAVMLTTKHHDGFCLWPSDYTAHSVKSSPFQNGKGDVVKAIAEACRKRGLQFSVYLSPWDRNHAAYGTPAYIDYFRNQLRELLTNYGPIFEVWFDGANGGDGFYGGAKEKRSIDRLTYYDWPTTWNLVRELQPMACLFSDAGPDVRWVGNEKGFAGETCWSTLNAADFSPGIADAIALEHGQRPGTHWLPAEVDVSIRPGWFWHEHENHQVKSPAKLLQIYCESVGRGANLILNIPPDRRGLIHETDVAALKGWKALLDATFATDLSSGAAVVASQVRGDDKRFTAANLLDGNRDTYWATDDGVTTGELVVDFHKPTQFNVVRVREFLPLGQRVEAVALDIDEDGVWKEIATATSIGNQRLLVTDYHTTTKLRLRVTQAAACPALSELAVFAMPQTLEDPAFTRTRDGDVRIALSRPGHAIYYTVDGREPDTASIRYIKPIPLPRGGTIKARAIRPDGQLGAVMSRTFGLATAGWTVLGGGGSHRLIDCNDNSISSMKGPAPQSAVIDMGKTETLTGLTLLPRQDGRLDGTPDRYEIAVSPDGNDWQTSVATGEFSNIRANPVRQMIAFATPVSGRYLRITITRTIDGQSPAIAELEALGR